MDPQFAMVVCALKRPYSLAHWLRSSLLAPLAPLLVRPFGGSSAARWQVRAAPGASKAPYYKRNGQPEENSGCLIFITPVDPSSPARHPAKRASRTASTHSNLQSCSPDGARGFAPQRKTGRPRGPTAPSSRPSGVSEIPASRGNFRQPMRQKKRKRKPMPASTRRKKHRTGASG